MEFIGKGRAARRTYGFEEIALVPASATVDPEDVDTSWQVAGRSFALPVIAAAMDSVVDVGMAAALSKLGAMAVLNLEGIQTRYANPREVLDRLAAATPRSEEHTSELQSQFHLVCRLLLEKKKKHIKTQSNKTKKKKIQQQ